MVEGKSSKLQRRRGSCGRAERPVADRARHRGDVRFVPHVRHDHDTLDGRDAICDAGHCTQRIDLLPCITITVGAEEHAGRDLSEAVEDSFHAEIRRARRPDCADAHCCKHCDRRLGNVRHEARDSIAGDYVHRAQRRRDACHLSMKLGERQSTLRPLLVPGDDRGVAVPMAQ